MDVLIENAKKMPKEKSMMDNLGLGNLVNISELDDQIKSLNENDIKSTSNEISKILGADDNPDVKDICDLLVTEIFGNLKETGISGVFDTIQNVQNKLKDTLGSKNNMEKMEKTKTQLDSFMKNAKEKVSQMKDENGNPIGDNIMKMFGNDMINQLQAKHAESLNK
jgi:predicted transcriptional regulator